MVRRSISVRYFFFFLSIAINLACSTAYQQVVATMRKPGEHIKSNPDDVWAEYQCGERKRPFVQVESMEIVPAKVNPGDRINTRVVYIMCPDKPSQVIRARTLRRIHFKGEQVSSNVTDTELKPGRWVIDSRFTLPEDAPLGVYSLEISFDNIAQQAQKQARSFVVSQ